MMLTDRFSQALMFAERLHREQTRKGNDIPYVARADRDLHPIACLHPHPDPSPIEVPSRGEGSPWG